MLRTIIKHCLTSSDGETFAIGRVMGAVMFGGGTPLPVIIGAWNAITGSATLEQWGSFLGSVAAYYAALVGAITGLIALTNHTEPREPSPPAQ